MLNITKNEIRERVCTPIIRVGTPALDTPCPGSLNPMKTVEEIIEGTEREQEKKRSPKRAEGGAEAKVDRAVLHILTVLRVPPTLVKFVCLFSF